ncbi:DUF4365 domain-containing protein [Roseobacter sp. HKCCD9010]|uniref:DUF4365 domain-containing protein n=1 Tax=unclassified Roseobacter TaxID=196798 RepID=UPI001492A3BA|nr:MULTISPECIES: DUF4365 domain-containing protein [unclassified Roseobacter]MBF9052045.1 DUF4365 domain-containing protein [Rhodobacterales bacterium HKCCD4356]NNV13969.1 DUF4365 domain-containing protein [Roseobacter sp. HKCCD7357]NNV18210.1 DUF4365 domain-containing protein [Roseobacter sp. HKCCD8768]NNV27670.1 DUF4365 domain-containing protein [Roseobacter sp. HKCCD8192]NNV31982.1 DUF4365 domain-containing protein [Roseobacter sp. HKCCD9061]
MKIVTDNQMTGDTGEAIIKAEFQKIGLIYQSFGRLESGTDGMVELRDPKSGETSSQFVAVQAKTRVKGNYSHESDNGFDYLIDEKDLKNWKQANLPLIVVLHRMEDNSTFWKPFSDHVPGEERRLRFNKAEDRLTRSSVDAIAGLMVDQASPGVWIPPLNTGETAVLNMFRVVLPDEIFVAVPVYPNGRQASAVMAEEDDGRFDWSIRGNRFVAFHDPRGEGSELLVETDTVEAVDTELIANTDDQDDQNDIAHLLRRCLERQFEDRLMFGRHQGRPLLMFRPEDICKPLDYSYRSATNPAKARVVAVKMRKDEEDRVAYVRHHAFHPKFERIGQHWFLVVEPTYFFTHDGFRWHQRAEALLSGKKRLEKNSAIWGQVLMWQHLLCKADERDIDDLFHEPTQSVPETLRFEPAPVIELPVATPEAAWSRSGGSDALVDESDQWELPV